MDASAWQIAYEDIISRDRLSCHYRCSIPVYNGHTIYYRLVILRTKNMIDSW